MPSDLLSPGRNPRSSTRIAPPSGRWSIRTERLGHPPAPAQDGRAPRKPDAHVKRQTDTKHIARGNSVRRPNAARAALGKAAGESKRGCAAAECGGGARGSAPSERGYQRARPARKPVWKTACARSELRDARGFPSSHAGERAQGPVGQPLCGGRCEGWEGTPQRGWGPGCNPRRPKTHENENERGDGQTNSASSELGWPKFRSTNVCASTRDPRTHTRPPSRIAARRGSEPSGHDPLAPEAPLPFPPVPAGAPSIGPISPRVASDLTPHATLLTPPLYPVPPPCAECAPGYLMLSRLVRRAEGANLLGAQRTTARAHPVYPLGRSESRSRRGRREGGAQW